MQKKYFSKYKEPLTELPYLAKVQLDSYAWLLKKGLKEVFDEFSPIEDVTGKEFALDFVNFSLDDVSRDEYHAKAHNLSYEAPLRVTARLTNKNTGEIKTQDIFFADFPLMTKRGTFIINGIERVIVSQLVRSFGVYFTLHYHRGKKLFGAKIIPGRGVWLEFETDAEGVIWVKIDRKRKISATTLLRIFGLEKESAIKERFRDIDNGEISFMEKTLSKDLAKTADDAYVEVYKRIRPGDLATPDNARHLIENTFSSARYDISPVGRYKTNIRFAHFKVPKPDVRVLTLDDIVCTISEIIRKNNTPDELPDDIDHLGHRRIRGMGEMLQNRLRVGLARMERHIRDRMSVLDAETLTPLQVINSRPFMTVLRDFFMTNQLSQFMDQVNVLAELEHKRRLSALGPGGLTRERAGFEVRDVHPSHYGRICPIQTPEGPNIGLVGHLSSYARLNDFGLIETPYRQVTKGKVTDEVHYLTALEESEHVIAHAGTMIDKNGHIIDAEVEARIKGQPKRVEREAVDYMDVATNQAFSIATSLIPFLGHDDANRALMGSNMQRQATPCIVPEAPLVG